MKKTLNLRKFLTILIMSCGVTLCTPNNKTFNTGFSVEARVENKTTKRKFLNFFRADPEFKKMATKFNNLSKDERENKNNEVMKDLLTFFQKIYKKLGNISEKEWYEIRKNDKTYTKESYVMEDWEKPIFKYFWDSERKPVEEEYTKKLTEKIIKNKFENNRIKNIKSTFVFATGSYGFEEVKDKQNAIAWKAMVEHLLDNGCIVLVTSRKLCEGVVLKEHENLIPFCGNKLPRIIGTTGTTRPFEADALLMRSAREYIHTSNPNAKFISVCVNHQSPKGFEINFQVDESTSNKTQKQSEKLAGILRENLKKLYKKNKIKGKGTVKLEDWAVINPKFVTLKNKNDNFSAVYLQLKNHPKKSKRNVLLKKEGKTIADSILTYSKKI